MKVEVNNRMKESEFDMKDASLDGIDLDQVQEELNIPDDPGPAVTGNTPVLGSLRRKNDLPVLRDELKDQL